MKTPAWLPTAVVASGLVVVLAYLFKEKRPPGGALAPSFSPVGPFPVPPNAATLPAPPQWVEVTSAELVVANGLRVLALVDLPWYVSTSAATPEAVRAYAEGKGWVNVQSQRYPGGDPADLLVMATWGRSFGVVDRPGAVVRLWRDLSPPGVAI